MMTFRAQPRPVWALIRDTIIARNSSFDLASFPNLKSAPPAVGCPPASEHWSRELIKRDKRISDNWPLRPRPFGLLDEFRGQPIGVQHNDGYRDGGHTPRMLEHALYGRRAGRQPRSLPCLMSSDVFDVAAIDANIVQFVVAQL